MPFLPLRNALGARLRLTEIGLPRASSREASGRRGDLARTTDRGIHMGKVPERSGSAQAGAGMGMSLAFEFAGSVALFWFLGFLVDRWFGSEPAGQVVGGVLGWVGGVAHVYYAAQSRGAWKPSSRPTDRRRKRS